MGMISTTTDIPATSIHMAYRPIARRTTRARVSVGIGTDGGGGAYYIRESLTRTDYAMTRIRPSVHAT